MAHIYKHKVHGFQIKYTTYFPDGSRKTKYRYTSHKGIADELHRDVTFIENGSRAGNLTPREISQARHDGLLTEEEARLLSGGKSVEPYNLERIMKNYEVASSLANTPYGHECNMCRANFLYKWLNNHPLPFLTSADVKLYAHMRKSGELVNVHKHTKHKIVGVSSKTINNELGILKDMVDEAVALGMVDTNVAREVNLPQKNNKIRRTLNRNEICKLLETAEIHRHLCRGYAYEIIMFGLFTGMRRAELRTLCWSDVDLETGKIAIQAKEMKGEHNFTTKSGVADTITIPDKLIPTIEGMSHSGRFVFGGDKPVSKVAISSGVKSIMTKAGFPKDVSLHHLRHTFGSWLLKTTGNLSHVKEAMRHLDIATTKLYMHTVAEDNDPTKSFDYE